MTFVRPGHDEMVQNLLDVYATVSDDERIRYAESYRNYYRVCASLSDASDLPIENIAAAFAWLSPQQSLAHNIEMLAALVDAYCDRKDLWKVELSQYPSNVENAIVSLLEGPFLMQWHNESGHWYRGKKVRSFFRNILQLDNFVTIDRHAVALAINNSERARNGRFVTVEQPRGGWYDAVANAYRDAAKQTGFSPAEFQAIVWCARRGTDE